MPKTMENIAESIAAIQLCEKEKKTYKVAKKLNIPEKTLRSWMKIKETVMNSNQMDEIVEEKFIEEYAKAYTEQNAISGYP